MDFDIKYFDTDIKPLLSSFEKSNLSAEYGRGIDIYLKRLKYIGLEKKDRILDAGGGAGNWAIPLSLLNKNVNLIDINERRLLIAHLLAKKAAITNLDIEFMSIEDLKFKENNFDAIFCYSVIMFSNIEKTLFEFHRVLKHGGYLYIQTDLWRWYLSQEFLGGTKILSTKMLKFFVKSMIRGSPRLLTINKFLNMLKSTGFDIISYGQDGETSFLEDRESLKKHRFYKLKKIPLLLEVCARKI